MIAPPLNAKIYNSKKTKEVQFKIVGFTERVPSILVPSTFMKWANDYFEPELTGIYQPVGKTDSEKAFCLLLETLRQHFPAG